jgi:hypothetical protein
MALPDLSGSNIQDTYQRVLHTDGTSITDGTGSEVLSATELTSLQTIGSAIIPSAKWDYVSVMQDVKQTAFVQFNAVQIRSTFTGSLVPSISSPSGRVGFAFQDNSNSTDINIIQDRLIVGAFKANGDISCSGNLIFDKIDGGTF